jgi:NTE family protein
VFDDNPLRDSIIFADQMWHTSGPEPQSLEDVLSRQKDIQFASRDDCHIARQQDLHRLRHIVRELVKLVPEDQRISPEVKQFAAYGCRTFMHVVRLNGPHIEGEGNSRDIDFTSASIRARWKAGHDDTARALDRRPWEDEFDPMAGVAVHNCEPDMFEESMKVLSRIDVDIHRIKLIRRMPFLRKGRHVHPRSISCESG